MNVLIDTEGHFKLIRPEKFATDLINHYLEVLNSGSKDPGSNVTGLYCCKNCKNFGSMYQVLDAVFTGDVDEDDVPFNNSDSQSITVCKYKDRINVIGHGDFQLDLDPFDYDFDHDGFGCENCDASAMHIEDLVEEVSMYAVGEHVFVGANEEGYVTEVLIDNKDLYSGQFGYMVSCRNEMVSSSELAVPELHENQLELFAAA